MALLPPREPHRRGRHALWHDPGGGSNSCDYYPSSYAYTARAERSLASRRWHGEGAVQVRLHPDGGTPYAACLYAGGTLYGTTELGGSYSCGYRRGVPAAERSSASRRAARRKCCIASAKTTETANTPSHRLINVKGYVIRYDEWRRRELLRRINTTRRLRNGLQHHAGRYRERTAQLRRGKRHANTTARQPNRRRRNALRHDKVWWRAPIWNGL